MWQLFIWFNRQLTQALQVFGKQTTYLNFTWVMAIVENKNYKQFNYHINSIHKNGIFHKLSPLEYLDCWLLACYHYFQEQCDETDYLGHP